MFWANVLQGVLSPMLVVLLVVTGNSARIMGKDKLGLVTNAGLVLGGNSHVHRFRTAFLWIGNRTGRLITVQVQESALRTHLV